MPSLTRRPASAPPSDPNVARILVPLTIDHPHAMVAKRAFVAPFVVHGGKWISEGLTNVPAGMLADDRSPLVTRYREHWRRPRPEDRALVNIARQLG